MKNLWRLGLFCFLLISCNQKNPVGFDTYLFPQEDLKKGIFNKYYKTTIPKNPNLETRVDVGYSKYQITSAKSLNLITYDAGFTPTKYQILEITDSTINLAQDYLIIRGDTTHSEILKPSFCSIDANLKPFVFTTSFGEINYQYKREIIGQKDSIYEDFPAKLIITKLIITNTNNQEVVSEIPIRLLYAQPYGLVWSKSQRAEYTQISELMEQIPAEKFEKLANHGRKRVGYINPENTLDDASAFKLCGKELNIADYYNSDPDAGFYPDKKSFLKYVSESIDSSLFKDASGYLTLRFVINCKGEAGRFTTEMASLDFEPKKFDESLINHLYSLLKAYPKWQFSTLRKGPTDAYFYVTFKFNQGELIEILP